MAEQQLRFVRVGKRRREVCYLTDKLVRIDLEPPPAPESNTALDLATNLARHRELLVAQRRLLLEHQELMRQQRVLINARKAMIPGAAQLAAQRARKRVDQAFEKAVASESPQPTSAEVTRASS